MSAPEFQNDEMLDEYDFSKAVRGNPYQHLPQSKTRIERGDVDCPIQIKTIEVKATVDLDGKVTIQLPPDTAPGEYSCRRLY